MNAYLRDLAAQVHAVAVSPENAARLRRWQDVNALRKPDRAPVFCRPVAAWKELLPEDTLRCTDPPLRAVETELRRILIKNSIGDDSVVLPYYPIETDVDYLEDAERTRGLIGGIFGDILPPKVVLSPLEPMTLGAAAIRERGMEALMWECCDDPDGLHRRMTQIRDDTAAALERKLATGLFMPNTKGPMYASDELDPAPGEAVALKHCVGVGNSQEFDTASPAMWEEFLLEYQKPLYARFGLAAYGCCENLTRKIDGILTIPNLRIFVCSAWTDLDRLLDKTGGRYCIMWRQKATEVCFTEDTASIRAGLIKGCEQMRGGRYQIVLRELETLNGDLNRLHVWTQLAIEAASKY